MKERLGRPGAAPDVPRTVICCFVIFSAAFLTSSSVFGRETITWTPGEGEEEGRDRGREMRREGERRKVRKKREGRKGQNGRIDREKRTMFRN